MTQSEVKDMIKIPLDPPDLPVLDYEDDDLGLLDKETKSPFELNFLFDQEEDDNE